MIEEPTVTKAIKALAPNAEFSYDTDGDGNWTITNWYSDDIDQPSNSDIEAKLTELQADYNNKQYQRNRAIAYPALEEQFDKLWHDINNGTLDDTGEFFTALKTVKDDNPKPSE